MAHLKLLLGYALIFLASSACVSAKVVEHTFHVQNLTVQRLCQEREIIAINGKFPGPTIHAKEGDTLIVHVLNKSPYNMTIHWHGVIQLLSGWADGPEYITQCPIIPGKNYTYKFNVDKQEGTLWWHAHISFLRATVYGALIIRPRSDRSYPFPKPYKEFPILLGEWWNANVVDVENEAIVTGRLHNISDAFTINGQPGDLYPCSSHSTYKLNVKHGKRYLLRVVNAAMQGILFFKIANHKMTVVAVDASYTNPYTTDVVVIAPGQTTDVILTADQLPGSYYMATRVYQGSSILPFDKTSTTGIIAYDGSTSLTPLMPSLPAFNDNTTVYKFFTNLTGLTIAPFWKPVPKKVDERLFITIGLGLVPCGRPGNASCEGPFGERLASSMNNMSFEPPRKLSMLQAFFNNIEGIYTTDFPSKPPLKFDYTNPNNTLNKALLMTTKATKVKRFKYNSTVEIVMQNTVLGSVENHPMHLHGFDFHVLAQGFGNYDPKRDQVKFNLINPHIRSTVDVPIGGWTAIRFQADNPGVWLMHCHLEIHMPWGLASAFVVENGPTLSTSLPSPPADLPQC